MSWYDTMTIDLPECEEDGLRIERFTVERDSIANWRLGARSTRPGTYTGLMLNGRLWMSDTDAEKRDHMEAAHQMVGWRAKRVLINGLGLGMVLKAALSLDHIERVDVVENDERVLRLVGAYYARDSRVRLHHADAYEQMSRWPVGTCWDVAWSDIWPDLCTDNLESMAKLRRSYGRRTKWHDCWGRELLVSLRNRERAEEKKCKILRGWHNRIMQ